MRWLHEAGLISNYQDYLALPAIVLEEARLVMTADLRYRAKERERIAREVSSGKRR